MRAGVRVVVVALLLLVVVVVGVVAANHQEGTAKRISMEDKGDSWLQLFSSTTKNQPDVVGACVMATQAGDVFVVGGASPDGTLQSTFTKFVFAKNEWAKLSPFPTGLFLGSSVAIPATTTTTAAAAAASSPGYGVVMCVFGGQTTTANLSRAITCFNTTAGESASWVEVAPSANSSLPRPRRAHAAVLTAAPDAPQSGAAVVGAGFRLVVFGGQVRDGERLVDSDELWTFDFATATWTLVAASTAPLARHGHGMTALPSGAVLVFWGNSTGSGLLRDSWVLAVDGQWSPLPSPSPFPSPSPRAFPVGGVLNGTVVSYGGSSNTAVLADMLVLDPERLVWHVVNSSSAPLGRWGAGVSAHANDLFMMGGSSTPPSLLGASSTASTGSQLWQLHISDVCGLFDSCGQCTTMASQCGWCMSTGTCQYATGDTPPPTCPRGFFTNSCPNCSATTCSECSGDDSCVWCEDSHMCTAGDAQGPFSSSCVHYYSDKATCSQCPTHTGCAQCLADERCGWCFANKTCNEGDHKGPFYNLGCRRSDSWWIDKTCPECHNISTCADCTSQAHCGFCLPTGKCVEGSSNGSFDASECTRGYHFSSPCPNCNSDPAHASSCRRCTNHTSQGEKCGWCGSTKAEGFCGAGDVNGPFVGSCLGQWFSESRQCTSCAQNYDCGVCVLDPDCVWCRLFAGYCVPMNESAHQCPSSEQITVVGSCTVDPPSWDPNGWNARSDYTEVAVVMGVITAVALMGLVGVAWWWRRQARRRLLPDSMIVAQERERLREERDREREGYLYRRAPSPGNIDEAVE